MERVNILARGQCGRNISATTTLWLDHFLPKVTALGISGLCQHKFWHIQFIVALVLQVKPKAGIFVDEFSAADPAEVSNGSLKMHYTMVADELALYNMSVNKSLFGIPKIEVDTQKRWVAVRRGGLMCKELH